MYKVVLNLDSADKFVQSECSNENYGAELSCGAVYHAVQCGSNF